MQTLVFCAGAADPYLESLATMSFDALIGVDGGAAQLTKQGWTLDWAVGDFDSAPPPLKSRHVLHLSCDKDDTDLEAALLHVLPLYSDVKQIIILGALGAGRLDHLLANIWLFQQPRFAPWAENIRFIERHNTVSFYRAGQHHLHREPDKHYLSFIGLSPLKNLHLNDVRYPLYGIDYDYPSALVSNEFLTDKMFFSFQSGALCVIQSRDA